MSNNLKDLHSEVFTEVVSKITHIKRGILYETIQIILAHLGLRGKWYSIDTIIGDMVGL